MGLFSGKNHVLFSGLKGQLLNAGKPMADQKIELFINDGNNEKSSEYFYTDAEGYFDIPKVEKLISISPFKEFRHLSDINVILDNDEKDNIWTGYKRDHRLWGGWEES